MYGGRRRVSDKPHWNWLAATNPQM